ncbi:MAG TPA: YitT family protein [Bacilli bacterium]|nr:YitT family protein [Bacilli bacterium]
MKKKKSISIKQIKEIFKRTKARTFWELTFVTLMVILSAFTFALSFRLFIAPTVLQENQIGFVSGGVSGLSQNVVKLIYDIFGVKSLNPSTLQSILYFILNIPVFFLGWRKIGKRFTIFSILNVFLASFFIFIIPESWENAVIYDSQLTRTLYAGILSGFSGAIAFKANVSSGGMDVVAYYFANRRSEGVGKYTVTFNVFVVALYFILTLIEPTAEVGGVANLNIAITSFISSVTYLVMAGFVIDLMHVRNKKSQVQVITNKPELAKILITNFPHGATTIKGVGVYSNNEKTIIYMTVSVTEVNDVVNLIMEVDEGAFINVTDVRQVFGKFYIRPIK